MKKYINFDIYKSTYASPALKEMSQLFLLKKIESRRLLEAAEMAQNCYSIEQKGDWIKRMSLCFEKYKNHLDKTAQELMNAEKEMMDLDDLYISKEQNCYSLVSEFEMESCIKNYKLECLEQKQLILDRINSKI